MAILTGLEGLAIPDSRVNAPAWRCGVFTGHGVAAAGVTVLSRVEVSPSVGVPADKFSWFQLLADTPIEEDEQDRLGLRRVCRRACRFARGSGDEDPAHCRYHRTMGSGKTSLAKMVEARLQPWPKERGEAPNIVCWFNAWLHDDAPDRGLAFAA